jgi:hypothetical protein
VAAFHDAISYDSVDAGTLGVGGRRFEFSTELNRFARGSTASAASTSDGAVIVGTTA